MKFTLSWLKSTFETDADARTIAETLTNIGLEVESLEDRGAVAERFHRRPCRLGREASQCRQAQALPR